MGGGINQADGLLGHEALKGWGLAVPDPDPVAFSLVTPLVHRGCAMILNFKMAIWLENRILARPSASFHFHFTVANGHTSNERLTIIDMRERDKGAIGLGRIPSRNFTVTLGDLG